MQIDSSRHFIAPVLTLLALVAGIPDAQCQSQSELQRIEEMRQRQEEQARADRGRQIDSAVYYMDVGSYDTADKRFRDLLGTMKSVPSDFTFFFGKNSYHLGKFKQSIDWINKYIALKGTTGQYYEEAVGLLKKAEASYLESRQHDAQTAQEILSRNYDIDCGPSGKVICPVCKGRRVIITRGPFGDQYNTCQYCDEHGLMACPLYNKLVRGEWHPGDGN